MQIVFIILPLLILAVLFFVFVGRAYWIYRQLRKNGIKTQGEITDYEEYSNSKGKKSFFPIIKFRTQLGQEVQQRTLYGFGAGYYIEKGSKVGILYSAKKPDRMMLENYNPFRINPILLIATIFCLSMAVVIFLLSYTNPHWIQELIDSFE